MRISKNISDIEGVEKAVAVMATEKAKFALKDAGVMTEEIGEAGGGDLVIVVEAKSAEIAEETLEKMEDMVSSGGAQARKPSSSNILNDEIQAINIGLEAFKDALEAQDVKVRHVDWRVPAKGDVKLLKILKKMY
jgi:nitrate reductase NapAB chaperone NapD